MAAKNINARIQHKREFEINWLSSNFVPLQGEIIIYLKEIDPVTRNVLVTKKDGADTPVVPCNGRTEPYSYDRIKIGDGKTSVNDLEFADAHLHEAVNSQISYGTADPGTDITSQFYFKYSV